MYIENLEMKFGRCELPEVESAFNPAQIDQYISNMLPGLASYRARQKTPLKQRSNSGAKQLSIPVPNTQKEFDSPLSRGDINDGPKKKSTPVIEQCASDEPEWKEDLQTTIKKVTSAYERIIASNGALENQLKDKDTKMESMMKSQNQKIKSLEEHTRTLTTQIEVKDKRFRELENLNTTLVCQAEEVEFKMKYQREKEIAALKRQHEAEIKALNDEIRRMAIERNEAVTQVELRCKTFCAAKIEEAKANQYCVACGTAKYLGITFCDVHCSREYSKIQSME